MPRLVEDDARGSTLARRLAAGAQPLWKEGSLAVARVVWGAELKSAIASARAAGRVLRGLEAIEKALAGEERGLRRAEKKHDRPQGVRVSRLLLVANDGSERFYRNVESLLRRHGPRLLAVQLDADAADVGASFFGPNAHARALLLEHKEAVSQALLAMVIAGEPLAPRG